MFKVVVKDVRGKLVASRKFDVEADAWTFFERWDADRYLLEFRDLNPFRR